MNMRALTALLCPLLLLSGCNIFGFMDSPSGDAQILSAARAALDRGDYDEARSLYAELSSNQGEVVASETAFADVSQAGVDMATFMSAFGAGGDSLGPGFTTLSDAIAKINAGAATRKTIYDAYLETNNITSNTKLLGLVRVVTGAALAAEILAEDAGLNTAGQLDQADLTTDPSACAALGGVACVGAAACGPPTGAVLTAGTVFHINAGSPSATAYDTGPTLAQFNAAAEAISTGLSEVDAGGKFASSLGFFTQFASLSLAGSGECYREGLLSFNIGH